MRADIVSNFYCRTTESILSDCITVWHGSCSSSFLFITGNKFPALQDIYQTCCLRKAHNIIKIRTHPAFFFFTHFLFVKLPSGRRFRSHPSQTTSLKNNFYLQASSPSISTATLYYRHSRTLRYLLFIFTIDSLLYLYVLSCLI